MFNLQNRQDAIQTMQEWFTNDPIVDDAYRNGRPNTVPFAQPASDRHLDPSAPICRTTPIYPAAATAPNRLKQQPAESAQYSAFRGAQPSDAYL